MCPSVGVDEVWFVVVEMLTSVVWQSNWRTFYEQQSMQQAHFVDWSEH